jgi:hypothetical protein
VSAGQTLFGAVKVVPVRPFALLESYFYLIQSVLEVYLVAPAQGDCLVALFGGLRVEARPADGRVLVAGGKAGVVELEARVLHADLQAGGENGTSWPRLTAVFG